MSDETEPVTDVEWNPLKETVEAVEECLNGNWRWIKNTSCKYVSIQIDMRDGHCLLKDRYGNVIDIDTLKHQLKLPKETDGTTTN